MLLTPKQAEYVRQAHHRWNFKGGATRSGKTYLDFHWIIPIRIRERIGMEGLTVILGVTKSTIERNVLRPMREVFGPELVGSISSDNTVKLFGDTCYALGAEKLSQVSKLQGASFKYTYGDEVANWAPEVFDMLKSRLDKSYSCFDGTYNPQGPQHWLKKFLDSDADIFSQTYCLDDNPTLDPDFVTQLKKEYTGSVLYDRFILGLWAAAEGAVYRPFADNPARFIVDDLPDQRIRYAQIGVDFGGGSSAHAFCCVGFTNRGGIVVLDEYREKQALDPVRLAQQFVQFVRRCQARWLVPDAYCDSAEQTLINGLRTAAAEAMLPINISNAQKRRINDRIEATLILMSTGKFHIARSCTETIEALQAALWDSKKTTEDVRLDNGTTNIDSLDAFEYAWEREIETLIDSWCRS